MAKTLPKTGKAVMTTFKVSVASMYIKICALCSKLPNGAQLRSKLFGAQALCAAPGYGKSTIISNMAR